MNGTPSRSARADAGTEESITADLASELAALHALAVHHDPPVEVGEPYTNV